MALTQISTQGIKDGTISSADLADQSVTLAKLPHGTSSNDGKFLRANNGADPTFETVSSIGGGTGVDFDDNVKARFGTGNDLEIYHSGSHSYIENSTNFLFIHSNSLALRSASQETFIDCSLDGSVDLYYDNSKKFETRSNGANLIGNLESNSFTATNGDAFIGGDNKKLVLGTGSDLQIYHDGSHSRIDDTGTGSLVLRSSNFLVEKYGGDYMINGIADGAVELYHDNNKRFETSGDGSIIRGPATTTCALKVIGGENHSAEIQLIADEGDDFSDVCRIHQSINNRLYIQNLTGAGSFETMIEAVPNGSVMLYHDNSKKFETTSSGIAVTGGITTTTNSTFDGNYQTFTGANYNAFWDKGGNYFKFVDNAKAVFGSSQDLQIYHDGSNSYLVNTTGELNIRDESRIKLRTDQFVLNNHANDESIIYAAANGAVELYYDNSKKFETYSNGCTVTGNLNASNVDLGDNAKARFGSSNDLQIYHDGSNSIINDVGTGTLRIQTDGANQWEFNGTIFKGNDGRKIILGDSSDLQIYHDPSTNNIIDNAGSLTIRKTDGDKYIHCSSNAQVELYYDNSKKLETTSGGVSVTGALTASGNITAFSDVTLKEDINTISDALSKVLNLRGVSYSRKDTKQKGIGVVAQEIEKVLPEVVENGEYKSVAYGNIVALLIEAIKDLNNQVNELKK